MKVALVLLAGALIAGCAGQVDYAQPTTSPVSDNQKTINKPREEVWSSSVPQLGKQFFVINNIDKSSGLINISYTGDPERYIDCGRVTSYVKNARGERTYDFPAAKSSQKYEVMEPGGLYIVDRDMSLDGRVNLIFEETSPNTTKVTANTRYIVTRDLKVRDVSNNMVQSDTESISFNSGGGASFTPNTQGQATRCVPTGELEQEILSAIN